MREFAKATAPYPVLFIGFIAAILGATATSLIAPLLLKQFIDLISMVGVDPVFRIAMLTILGWYAVVTFANWLSVRLQMMTITNIEARVEQDLINQGFEYLIGHGHDFFIDNFTGTLTRRVSRYAHSYQQVFNCIMEGMVPTLLFAIGVITVLFLENAWLGWALLIWTVFFLILQYVMTKWRYQYKLQRSTQDSRLTGALSDSVGNHSSITFFAAENTERTRFAGIVKDW